MADIDENGNITQDGMGKIIEAVHESFQSGNTVKFDNIRLVDSNSIVRDLTATTDTLITEE